MRVFSFSNRKLFFTTVLLLACGLQACQSRSVALEPVGADRQSSKTASLENSVPAYRVAFGSCLKQWKPQKIWDAVVKSNPDAFVFMGDNVYSDMGDYRKLRGPKRIFKAYQDLLTETPDFLRFKQHSIESGIEWFATWDDHDYGLNDSGAEFPYKLEAKKAFQSFYQIEDFPVGSQDAGIYQSYIRNKDGLAIQYILLDTRSFRSALVLKGQSIKCPRKNIGLNNDPSATILGAKQWQWLKGVMRQPADLRLIVTSIQFIPEQHCFEKWSNFPHERKRMLDLIVSTHANGVLFLSGDRHLAEISKLEYPGIDYTLYEITSSGLNSAVRGFSQGKFEKNKHRVLEKNVLTDNFALLDVFHEKNDVVLEFSILGESGDLLQSYRVSL